MNDDGYNELMETSWRRKLTLDEEAQLRGWLASHPDKQAEWEEEIALTQQLDRLPNAPLASNFTAQVLGQLDLDLAREERQRSTAPGPRSWWRQWAPRFASVLLLGTLAGTAVVQYREHQRNQVVQGVMQVTPVAAVLAPEILRDFDAIQQLGHVRVVSDDELVAALQ